MTTPATPNPNPPAEAPAPGPGTPPAEAPAPAPGTDSPAGGSGDDKPLGPEGERALARLKQELAAEKAKVKELSPLAEQARQAAEAQKTEQQRADEARAAAEARASQAETELRRLRIGSEKNLPPFLVDRIMGSNEEEMRADADRLAAEWSGRTPAPPSGAGDAGRGGSAVGADMNSLLRAAVRGG